MWWWFLFLVEMPMLSHIFYIIALVVILNNYSRNSDYERMLQGIYSIIKLLLLLVAINS